MSLVVNNNMMAANTARNLNAHYGRLATSTQRLSSGLRVNSAADDAAGLAIRELQRADIAALHQGARNANDAISMIQVADGSLGIIDEKLIRMKELAEQAATGTYDSTQRLMIESEYQAMASEITRIANATDFNGTKLLDGTLAGDHDGSGLISEGKMKIHFGTGNDSAEDYYYVEIGECTSEAFGLGNNSTWQDVQRRANVAFKDSLLKQIKESDLDQLDKAKMLAKVDDIAKEIDKAISDAIDPVNAYMLWSAEDGITRNDDGSVTYDPDGDIGFLKDGKNWPGNSDLMDEFLAVGAGLDIKGNGAATAAVTGAISTAAADPALEKEIQDAAAAKVNSILTALNNSINNATAPTDEAEAKKVYTDAIDAAIAEAGNQGIADTTALKTALDNALAANETGLWNATDNAIDTTVQGELNAALGEAVETAAPAEALAAAKEEAKLPGDADAIKDAIQKAFTDSLADAIAAGNITDVNTADAAVDDAVAAALQAAEDSGFTKDSEQYNALKNELDAQAATLQGGDLIWDGAAGGVAANATANINKAIDDTLAAQDVTAAIGEVVTDNVNHNNAVDQVTLPAGGGLPTTNEDNIMEFWNSLRTTQQQKLQYAWGQAAIYNLANAPLDKPWPDYGIGATIKGFADADLSTEALAVADEMLKKALQDMQAKVGHMDFAGYTVETQEDAQMALDAINEAIVSKDKIRAHLGAAQNRLENTVSNLNIQAENLQAAESRISDVDVATEMTQFVRNQILTQSAVAMLSQANSLPQMAMQLIGG